MRAKRVCCAGPVGQATLHVLVPGPGGSAAAAAAVRVRVEACALGVHAVLLSGSGSFPADYKTRPGALKVSVSEATPTTTTTAAAAAAAAATTMALGGAEWEAVSWQLAGCTSWLCGYFQRPAEAGHEEAPALHLPGLAPDGFTNLLYRTLTREVCVGRTVTYGGLAELAGASRTAARAVGNAMRHNPVPLLVPCHRVVPAQGGSGSFQGRLSSQLKAWLLRHEQGTDAPTSGP
ncbi:methylated-DNA--protein-cysteine methyltransferase isoform X1 [Petromyzon marinus]|uniref:methylated-DNA--protein-cysteine methyltransferase isoform X1 n=1 Tax=Petromyzon marinus TaxID=7757 RepID=UPI003F6F487C